jgi:putative peptidoglycan lipid II flippase
MPALRGLVNAGKPAFRGEFRAAWLHSAAFRSQRRPPAARARKFRHRGIHRMTQPPAPSSGPDATPPPVRGRSLLRSAGLVSLMTMLSRIMGLVRDVVIANTFGASAATDAFFVAFKIPNFLRRLFAEGAFAQAFVPVLSEYKVRGPHAAVKELVDKVAARLGFILVLITVAGVAGAPVIIGVFAPGFVDEPGKFALASDMLRITFPYLLLISLTALAGGILNTYGRFGVPAFTPVLLNLSMIGAALFLTDYMPAGREVMALAWGVFIAGVAQLAFQLPFLMKINLLPRPRRAKDHEGVGRILKLMLPAMFGVSVGQINLLLDTILASFLITGSITWLYAAERLTELPLGVIGIAIGTVILPSLSEKHVNKSAEDFSRTLDWALRLTLVVGVPAAVAIGVMAEPLLAALFQHGSFTASDVVKSAMALQAYSLGIVCFMLVKVLAPGYYARQDIATPVKIGIRTMVANMLFNLVLVWWLAHVGLALASSLAAVLNVWWLYSGLRRNGTFIPMPGWGRFALQLGTASLCLAMLVWWLCERLGAYFSAGVLDRAWSLTVVVVAGMAIYFVVLFLLGMRPRHLRH